MVGNVTRLLLMYAARACKEQPLIGLEDHDISVKGASEGDNLKIVAIGASLSHASQAILESAVNVLMCRHPTIKARRESSSILTFGVSSRSSSRENVEKGSVVILVLTHVLNHPSTDLMVLCLVSVQLVTEGIEETISCAGGC